MAKVNVNAAAREELVEAAELRPELAEAIIKFRDQRGKIGSVEELDEVQGVGPATLERLRETLSFGATAEEKAERERARAEEKAAQDKEQIAREKAEAKAAAERERVKAEEKAERTAREMAEKTAEAEREAVKAGAETAAKVVRSGLELVQKRVGATAEVQRETVRMSAEGTAEFGRLAMELFSEQARQNMAFAEAFGRAFNWNEMAKIQSEYLRASFERMNQLNSRYAEIVQDVMKTATESAKEQMKKAA